MAFGTASSRIEADTASFPFRPNLVSPIAPASSVAAATLRILAAESDRRIECLPPLGIFAQIPLQEKRLWRPEGCVREAAAIRSLSFPRSGRMQGAHPERGQGRRPWGTQLSGDIQQHAMARIPLDSFVSIPYDGSIEHVFVFAGRLEAPGCRGGMMQGRRRTVSEFRIRRRR